MVELTSLEHLISYLISKQARLQAFKSIPVHNKMCLVCFVFYPIKAKTVATFLASKCGFIFWKPSAITTKHSVFFQNKLQPWLRSPRLEVLCKKNRAWEGDSLLLTPFFLTPIHRNPPWILKCLITHTFFSFLILVPLICCSFICCHGFQIEAVEEARTFSILQLKRESPGYGRQTGKNMAVMWSTSHSSASWTMFTYINCWLMHRLIQAKQCVQSTFFPAFVLCSTNF